MMVPLRKGARRPAVRDLQIALNARATPRDLPQVLVDGELGPATLASVQRVGRALGALEATLRVARTTGIVSVGLQRMIRDPDRRTEAQLARARDRAAVAARATQGPAAALSEAARQIGKTERTDRAWVQRIITACIGVTYRVPWCGCFVHHCLTAAGVQGLTGRMAGVVLILDDAINGRNGLERLIYRRKTGQGSVRAGKPGDVVGLFGESTHTGLIVRRVPGGYLTREGNTGDGNQANGGTVQEKFRPDSAVVYIVRPKWPS